MRITSQQTYWVCGTTPSTSALVLAVNFGQTSQLYLVLAAGVSGRLFASERIDLRVHLKSLRPRREIVN